MDKVIHFSDWAGQPNIHIACMEPDDLTTPDWDCTWDDSPFIAENGMWYTFDENEVTCEKCIRCKNE